MKVLYVTMQFGRGYTFGTERYVTMLCDGMRGLGHEAVVMAGDPEQRGPRLPAGEPVPDEPALFAYPTGGWMTIEGLTADTLTPILERERPDLIHLANPGHVGVGMLEAGRRLGVPVVVTIMDYWWLCPKHTLRHFRRGLCDGQVSWRECLACVAAERPGSLRRAVAALPVVRDWILPAAYFRAWRRAGVAEREIQAWPRRQATTLAALEKASAVIFPSQAADALLSPSIAGQGPATFKIPYGIDDAWFAARTARRPRLPGSPIVIGYGGALAPHKGAHVLLAAMVALGWTDAEVRLAGGGPAEYVSRLRRIRPPAKVTFLGSLAPLEMPGFVAGCDVYVLPSLWPENLPIAALEATAAGAPVLASRIPGVQELVPAERQFEVGSATDLARALDRWRAGDGAAMEPKVARIHEMVAATHAVYRGLVAKL